MANDLTLMLTCRWEAKHRRTPREQMPLGRGTPVAECRRLDEGDVKEDLAWLPSFDPEFQNAYLNRCDWNTAWPQRAHQPRSNSGTNRGKVCPFRLGADLPPLPVKFIRLCRAVLEARKEAGVKVLIGGACSSANTRENSSATAQISSCRGWIS